MNAFWLKVIAILTMLVDHFGLFFFPHSFVLQFIGRLSFPIIAWLIANGAIHTSSMERYMSRMLIFAILAQIPYEIGFYLVGTHALFLNVLFTLLFGLFAITAMRRTHNVYARVAAVIAMATLATLVHADYGAGGVLSIVAFYVFFNKPWPMFISQAAILGIFSNLGFFVNPSLSRFEMHPLEAYGIAAIALILLYNGKRGYATGYFFYWFFVIQNFAMLGLKYYLGHR